jgi:hypothetical protein
VGSPRDTCLRNPCLRRVLAFSLSPTGESPDKLNKEAWHARKQDFDTSEKKSWVQVRLEIPHHSTFSKNRHGRFQESKLFEELFELIVRQCVAVRLVQGRHLSVDGSFVEANAAKESRIPREQLAEAAHLPDCPTRHTIQEELQSRDEEMEIASRLAAGEKLASCKRID